MITLPHLCRRAATALLIAEFALAPHGAMAGPLDLENPVKAGSLPGKKRTEAGLYITSRQAARVLEEHDNVAFVDVRTPAEVALIGHATMLDAHIPVGFMDPTHRYSAKHGTYAMTPNPDFVKEFKAWLKSDAAKWIDTVLVSCRSRSRSKLAIDILLKAGVDDVALYSVVDGFEGDKNENGVRNVNGWRNAGLPWTYKIRPGLWPGHN